MKLFRQAINIFESKHYKLSFDVSLDPLAHFCIKQLASNVAVLIAMYSN